MIFTEKPVQYRLMVHVFGAKSSPSCANVALRRTVHDNSNVTEIVRQTVLRSFYVDDLMPSVNSEESAAIDLIKEVDDLLSCSGFNLISFVSNSRSVISSVSQNKLSKDLKTINIESDDLPYERAIGVVWNVET